jgi:hypothetical protein
VYGKCDELTYLSGKRTEHIVRLVCHFLIVIAIVDKLLQEVHEEVILYEVKTSAFSLESRFIDFFLFSCDYLFFLEERKQTCLSNY